MEEDIKQLEELILDRKSFVIGDKEHDEIYLKDISAIENLIKGYRELEEDNQKLESGKFLTPAQCVRIGKDYIPKSKVKEKIEETNQEKLNYSEDEWYLESEIKAYAIEKLQELMEDK